MKRRTLLRAAVVAGTVLVFGAALSLRVRWWKCKACGMQEYERGVFGVVVEGMSEREYDEFGEAARWRKEHGRDCIHEWGLLSSRGVFGCE